MKCLKSLGVLSVTLTFVWSMTIETTSLRSTTPPISNFHKNVSNQLLESNASTLTMLDVRTPPKIKEKINNKQSVESSHAGIAIPIDADVEILEESTKKTNFYKLERPTTSTGGLSTWILLSGQQSSTTSRPTTKKPSIKPNSVHDAKSNETMMLNDKPMKIGKPLFKQRSTTIKPVTVGVTKTTTVKLNTFSPSTSKKPAKLTKVKASLLNNASSKTNNTSSAGKTKSPSSTTTRKPSVSNVSTISSKLPSTTEASSSISVKDKSSVDLPVEAKDGEQELPTTDEKKKKTQKRKKNKNKRRKTAEKDSKEGNDNKLKEIESAGTQLYSYLKSEIIPVTVGVSLVGLLVTAGLASYYFQPFAALRRSDPIIDRKDVDGGYYYHDDYSNSMPEEEAIGKVIAGMPDNALQSTNALQGNSYKPATSRNTYPQNVRYRHVDRRSQIHMNPYGSVEDVKINERDRTAVSYEQSVSSYNPETPFVVGGISKDVIQEVTPAVVPEHGPRNLKVDEPQFVVGNIPKEFLDAGASPRNLKIRRRREVLPDDAENEIDSAVSFNEIVTTSSTENIDVTTVEEVKDNNDTTEEAVKETTPHNVWNPSERPSTVFELLTDLFKIKVKMGLELIQNVTQSVSTYVSKVQARLNEHYRRKGFRNNAFKPGR